VRNGQSTTYRNRNPTAEAQRQANEYYPVPSIAGPVRYGDLVTEFDEELWYITMDFITVYEDGRLVVTFRDGSKVSLPADI